MNISQLGRMLFLLAAFLSTGMEKQTAAAVENILIQEDFADRDHWKDLHFPKISRHSTYVIEHQSPEHYLRMESNGSASAIVHDRAFNVYRYSRLRWRWKILSVYTNGTIGRRQGDDYPARIYVMFAYEPKKAGALDRIKYGIARKMYGEYPPHSTLNYVWANKKDEGDRIATSPYTDRAKMILLEKGMEKAGTWQIEEVNILDDYRAAFGTAPPEEARIAIMNDSDDTRESSLSYIDYMYLYQTDALP